ncbi:hypothetical protein HY637_04160 [Candidatus Woesearchaeota archaeon]|nr:hypothetical protein [Candidatus Woesearchaeota archaeon]
MHLELSGVGRMAVRKFEDAFTEYASGETLSPPPEIRSVLEQSGLEAKEQQRIRDYLFLQCAINSAPRIAVEFVAAFDQSKYNPLYTLEGFLTSWDPSAKAFVKGEEDLGPYSFVIRGIIDLLERSHELSGYLYGAADLSFLEGIEGFSRIGITSIVAHNPYIIKELFIGALPDGLKAQVAEIASDKRLANEGGNIFLDMFPRFRESRRFNLENFLKYFNIDKEEFVHHRTQEGSHYHMQRRLQRLYGTKWFNGFYELLDEPVKSRVMTLASEIGKKGTTEEEKIRLLETIANENGLKVLYMFADGGSDIGDMLVALNIHKLTPDEFKLLGEVTMGGKGSIRRYLGKCRFRVPDTDISYDWRRGLLKVCEGIDPRSFRPEEVAGAILINKAVQSYAADFATDKPGTLANIRAEIEGTDNPVYRAVIYRVLRHYELRLKVGQVRGLVDRLIVVS